MHMYDLISPWKQPRTAYRADLELSPICVTLGISTDLSWASVSSSVGWGSCLLHRLVGDLSRDDVWSSAWRRGWHDEVGRHQREAVQLSVYLINVRNLCQALF